MFHTAANQTPSSNNRYRVLIYLETSAFTTMILWLLILRVAQALVRVTIKLSYTMHNCHVSFYICRVIICQANRLATVTLLPEC